MAVMSSPLTTNQCFDVEQMRKRLNDTKVSEGSHLCFFFSNMKRILTACDHRSFSGINLRNERKYETKYRNWAFD